MRYLTAALCSVVLLGACTAGPESAAPPDRPTPSRSSPRASPSPSPSTSDPSHQPGVRAAARAAGANELGVVPVLMYHRILKRPRSDYDTTPEAFLDEMRTLYRSGYRPITAADLASGEVDLPAGTSPVVLTFDDSSREQLSYTKRGRISPRSAIGMLLAFSKTHPGFAPVATMYVNRSPFGFSDPSDVLGDLYERGFELGNHTADHLDLSDLAPAKAEAQLRAGARVITRVVPGLEVRTVALPYGRRPKRHSLTWRGRGYSHEGVFLVGSEPAPSPYSSSFDPHGIPRIRTGAGAYGARFWLRVIGEDPARRFVSDGDPAVVSFPKRLVGLVREGLDVTLNPY